MTTEEAVEEIKRCSGYSIWSGNFAIVSTYMHWHGKKLAW